MMSHLRPERSVRSIEAVVVKPAWGNYYCSMSYADWLAWNVAEDTAYLMGQIV
jgi:hypothetical protein